MQTPPSDMMGYGQQAGSTHHTVMHTCIIFIWSRETNKNRTSINIDSTVTFLVLFKSVQSFLDSGIPAELNMCECFCNDCPQRSWGKVMFLQASVILLTGGCLPQCMLGYPPGADSPLGADTPLEQTPHPPEQTPTLEQTLGADTPRSRHARS